MLVGGGAPRAGGRSPRPSDDVCAEPSRLESSLETRGVARSGAGPFQNRSCCGGGIGGKIRARSKNYFRFGTTRVCITLISPHRKKKENSTFFELGWEKSSSKQWCKQSYHLFTLHFRLLFTSCLLRSRNSYSGSHSRPFSPSPNNVLYGGGHSPQWWGAFPPSRYFVPFFPFSL